MAMMTLEEAREFFCNDKFASKALGAVIEEVSKEKVVCSFEIDDIHKNAIGLVMGGAIYTLCDFAFAIASNSGDVSTVTSTSNVSFLSAAKGKRLIATARPIKDGKTVCVYEVDVTDDLGTKVAFVVITGTHIAKWK